MSAFYPQGMESYNNSLTAPLTADYRTWKGSGLNSNPVAITAGNIRPLTNNDLTNVVRYKHGSSRPLKWQYRKGTTTHVPYTIVNTENLNLSITINGNREVKSSKSSSLIGQLIDRPGQKNVKQNTIDETNETSQMDNKTCNGICLVTDYYPNSFYLTNNPEAVCQTSQLCCNEQKKALLRVRPASTNLKKNYFTTLQQYRQNRCKTYDQCIFNFSQDLENKAKPGSPNALLNTYVANCYPNETNTQLELVAVAFNMMNNAGVFLPDEITTFYNSQITTIQQYVSFLGSVKNTTEAAILFKNFITNPYYGMSLSKNPQECKQVIYKPNNYQFATQGSVSSSTRTLKLGVTTIEKNVYHNNKFKNNYTESGGQPFTPFIYKAKTPACNPVLPIIFRQVSYNPKTCFKNTDDFLYTAPVAPVAPVALLLL